MSARVEGSFHVAGRLSCSEFSPPAASINAASIDGPLDADDLQHQHRQVHSQANTTATTETKIVHIAYGGGTVADFRAAMIGANVGAATVTFDLKKNGSSVLSSVVTLSSSHAAYEDVVGTLSGTPTYVAGDVFTVVITATAGGGTLGTGAGCAATFNEDPE